MTARSVIFDVIGRDNASHAFRSAAKSAETAAVGIDRSIAKMEAASARLHAVGQKMSKAITLPVIAAVGVAVDQAAKFQQQMTLLQTAGGESAAKMTVISKGLLTIAKETGTAVHDLGEGMYTVAKAGSQKWSAVDQLKVLKAAAQGAKAEHVDLGTATNALTSIMLGYKMSAGEAVKAENELIRGSALSKTTFQDFANSLSNVVPLAASLHVSFAQVAGAEATMTQHGESAQQATQNLHNILAALAGQNNVSSAAMQQLGINTVDLAKNLGTRGLAGSLAIVDAAIKRHTRNGMVMLDSTKMAKVAQKSLNTEVAAMPSSLAKQARALLDGSIHRKDFLKDIKGMSLQNQVLARNFLVTANQAYGFNTQLKMGKGNAETAAKAYQTMLGGVTGMNVALMVGGEYMGQTKSNIDQVALAAKKAGVDVLGWSETQGTLAVKLDKAKENLQVLAIEVGTALIPAISKLVGWITGAVKWFDGLSGGAKKFIGYTVLVLAAMGPLMAVAGRVGKAFALMWTMGLGSSRFIAGMMQAELSMAGMQSKSYLAGLKLQSMFSGGISAARGFGAALGGAGVGAGIGMLTRHASGAKQAVGALASAATGFAIGFASGGGVIGGAIGAGAGLLANLATNFLGAGKAAHAAVKPVDEYTQAILRDNQALGINVRAVAASRLGKEGAFDVGRTAGVTSTYDITGAAMGDKGAKARVVAAEGVAGVNAYTTALANLMKQRNITSKAGNKYALAESDALAMLTPKQRAAVHAAQKLNDEIGIESGKLKASKQAAKDYADATSAQGKNDKARAAALKALGKAQDAYNKMVSKGGKLATSVAVHGTSLDSKTGAGQANIAALRQMEDAANKLALSQILTGKSLGDVNAGLDKNLGKLRSQATQLGLNYGAVSKLLGQYQLTPKQIVTYLTANIDKGTASAKSLQNLIDQIKQNKVPGLKADSKQANAVIQVLEARIRALTAATPTIKLNVTAYWSPAANRALNLLNSGRHQADVTASRTQAVGTMAAFGQKTIPPNTTFTVGEGASHTWEGGMSDSQGRVSIFSNSESKRMGFRTPTHYASGTGKAPTGQKLSDVVAAFAGLKAAAHSISSTAQDLADATKNMKDTAKAAGASAGYLRTLGTQSAALVRLGRQRDAVAAKLGTAPSAPTAYDRLATAQQAYDSAKGSGSAVGAFDITSAGTRTQLYNDRPAPPVTASTILADLTAKVAKAKRFTYLIKRMIQLGLPKSFVEQFVQAGPDAATQAEALIKATPAQLALFRSDAKALDAASAGAGLAVANKFYRPGVQAAQGIVNGLLSQQKALNHAIKVLGDGMVAQLKRTLHIKSPSRVTHGIGVNVAEGFRLGIASKHGAVEAEANKMAHKGTGKHHHGHGQHVSAGGTVINNHWEIHPAQGMDEHQIAAIASRRLASLVY